MQSLNYKYTIDGKKIDGLNCCVGVVGSGNCEVLVASSIDNSIAVNILTSADGFDYLWSAVCEDFVNEYKPVGLSFTINDSGATPAVVSMRLRQALETYVAKAEHIGKNYLELDARERIASIFDDNSFEEFNCKNGCYSPHLNELGITGEHDDGIVIGMAKLNNKVVFVGAQQKDFIGGSVGEMHGAKLCALFKKAVVEKIETVILLIDSGGVRLHEANAGEISISEIVREIFNARANGIKTIGVVCGKNGAYGGMGIISATLDCRIAAEITRIGVSGAEVIQAVKGIEAFNSIDRALVWRVYGGKTRYIQKEVEYFVDNSVEMIKNTLLNISTTKGELSIDRLLARQAMLEKRFADRQGCTEEGEYLKKRYNDTKDVFDMNYSDFMQEVKAIQSEDK